MKVISGLQNYPSALSPLLSSPHWASIYGEEVFNVGVFSGDRCNARLALYSFQKYGKTFLITPPVGPHTGLHFYTESKKTATRNSAVKRSLRALADYLDREFSGAYIDIAFPPELKDIQPFLWRGFKADVAYTYHLHLEPTEKELMANMATEPRRNIRDATSSRLKVELNGEKGIIEKMVDDTLSRSGVKYQRTIIGNLLDARDDWAYSFTIHNSKKPVACILVGFDKNQAYYFAGGNERDTESAAGTLAVWSAICEAKKRGLKIFDFCGSTIPSIENYFRGFGAEITPYFRVKKRVEVVDKIKKMKNAISK